MSQNISKHLQTSYGVRGYDPTHQFSPLPLSLDSQVLEVNRRILDIEYSSNRQVEGRLSEVNPVAIDLATSLTITYQGYEGARYDEVMRRQAV